MSIITDPTPFEAPKDPEKSVIYAIYRLFASEEKALDIEGKFKKGGYGYGDAKKELFSVLWEYFLPYRAKREQLANNPDYVKEIRKKGADKARAIGVITLDKVRSIVGMQ
jgi:tryptophanyl-tRNA synthetase